MKLKGSKNTGCEIKEMAIVNRHERKMRQWLLILTSFALKAIEEKLREVTMRVTCKKITCIFLSIVTYIILGVNNERYIFALEV